MHAAATRYASRAGGYLREGPGGVNLEKVATYALLALGLYIGYKVYKGARAVGDAVGTAREYASAGVTNAIEWFFPLDIGEMTYYAVQFPDGNRHAVGSRAIDSKGYFTFTPASNYKGNPKWVGKRFRMAVDKSIVSGVNKFAIPV